MNSSKKLRIAVWHNLPSGGGKRALYYHVKGLVEKGHYVESWCPDTADQKFLPLKDIIKENIMPLRFKSGFNRQKIHSIYKDLETVKELSGALDECNQLCSFQINRGEFDVLFVNSCFCFRTSSIAKYVSLPSLVYLQEPYRWYYEALPELPWIWPANNQIGYSKEIIDGIRLQSRLELEYAKTSDAILVNSVYSREAVLRSYGLESKVCYLGVDTNYYAPTGEKKSNFVIGLGTIYHAKGIDRAIKAVASIKESIRPDLIWVGNGAWDKDLNYYQTLAANLKVNFIPKINIDDKELKSLLSRAAVMIYTSRLEPFGFAPLEANACETPVVAIAEGGVKETIIDGINGSVVLDDNPDLLGSKLYEFISNPEKAKKIGVEARKYVQTMWSFNKGTDNIENHLNDLLKTKKAENYLKAVNTISSSRESTNDIKWNVEKKEFNNGKLFLEGWAFIDDGIDAKDSQIYIAFKCLNKSKKTILSKLFKKNKKYFSVNLMEMNERVDVSNGYCNGCLDLKNSGFKFDGMCDKNTDQFIVIVRKEKVSLQKI